MKEILRLRVHFSYRLVVKIFATSTTSVSGTLSIFNLPNRKGICGNTNWGGHGNMFWNHLWIPSWRSIIFDQTQRRRALYYTRGQWPFKKKRVKRSGVLFLGRWWWWWWQWIRWSMIIKMNISFRRNNDNCVHNESDDHHDGNPCRVCRTNDHRESWLYLRPVENFRLFSRSLEYIESGCRGGAENFWIQNVLLRSIILPTIFASLITLVISLDFFLPGIACTAYSWSHVTCIDRVLSKGWLLIQSWASVTATINFNQVHLIGTHTSLRLGHCDEDVESIHTQFLGLCEILFTGLY